MIYLVQIVALIIIIFALSRVYLRFKNNKSSIKEVIFWTTIWILIAIVVFLPQTMTYLARMLGVGRGVDVVIYLGLLVLVYWQFRNNARAEKIEQDISKIVRDIALKKK